MALCAGGACCGAKAGGAEEKTREGQIGFDAPSNVAAAFVDNSISTTRYSRYTFVFSNLREQFRRKANIYFLIISVLMLLGWYSPRLFQSSINPWGTVCTLIFVLGVTLVKDGIEDLDRYRADQRENRSEVVVLRKGAEVRVERREVRVGDYVVVHNREQFPADLIVMAASDERGQCFVETSNIDGETNLKIRRVPQRLVDMGLHCIETLPQQGTFRCEGPNKNIHSFDATVLVNDETVPVSVPNFLLRGSVLRNTHWIVGLVVYTGEDSKIMKNRGQAPSKLSNIERTVNRLIVVVFLAHFALVVVSVVINIYFVNTQNFAYTGDAGSFILPYWLGNFFTFYILYSNFIPISLYVTIEMVNLIQAYFINADAEMYHEEEDVRAQCRNSTLCQELGQVEYVFSDKTGTLTRNIMEFKRASIGGRVYDLAAAEQAVSNGDDQATEFFRLLAVCHTVVPDSEGERKLLGGVECPGYEAESPDEGALVEAAAAAGVRFFTRTQTTCSLREGLPSALRESEYTLLAVNEFNSTRKRMSMLVRDPEGRNLLLCKGADNVMFDLAAPGQATDALNNHLTEFAQEGLRTLVCAQRELSQEECDRWLETFHAAELTLDGRAAALEAAAALVERNLKIVGASAIEDKLQDQVPETLVDLKKAGIKVWVLTGDKLETAVNIGYSCRLLTSTMRVVTIATDSKEQAALELLRLRNILTISKDRALMDRFRVGVARIRRAVRRVLPSASPTNKDAVSSSSSSSEPDAGLSESASRLADTLVREDEARRRHEEARTAEAAGVGDGVDATSIGALEEGRAAGASAATLAGAGSHKADMFASDADAHKRDPEAQVALSPSSDDEEESDELDAALALGKDSDPALGDADGEGDLATTDHLALVIDGQTLHYVMEDKELKRALLDVGRVCKAVIACRVSPAQKAELVTLVKTGVKSKPVTLSIGDGANDVTMIQRAHLGVGISGREGRQAVNASDFSIGQFRFLRKLLLVHGRWNYRRTSKVILVCFYKNIALVLTLFIYSFYTQMSGTSLYDSWLYSGFNWFSGMPPVLLGGFDKDMSAEFLLALPAMYVSGRKSMYLNHTRIMQWIARAILHATICAMVPITIGLQAGITVELTPLYSFGTLMFAAILITVIVIVGVETATWNGLHWFFYPGSILLFFISSLALASLPSYDVLLGVTQFTFSQALTWALAVFWIPLTCYVTEVLFKHIRSQYKPTLIDLGCEVDNRKSALSAEEFREVYEASLPRAAEVDARNIEDVMESTLTKRDSNLTLSARVARSASSNILYTNAD